MTKPMDSKNIDAEEDKSLTKPMEMCDNKQDTAEKKRKPVDSLDVDQGGEDLDYEDMDEEYETDESREENQEWGYDSFDEGKQYRPKRIAKDDEEGHKLRRYFLQIYQSNGFFVEWKNYPGRMGWRELVPVNLDLPFQSSGVTGHEYMRASVDLALAKYNKVNSSNVSCEKIVRAIISAAAGIKLYITFMAKETPDGEEVEYQAKTQRRPWQCSTHALFCRRAPEPKVIEVPSYEDGVSTESASEPSSRESDQEWGVDSMDDESEYKPPDIMEPSEEEIQKIRQYRPRMYKSKGFYVEGESYPGKAVYFSQVALDKPFEKTKSTGLEYMKRMVKLALDKYNEIENTNVTCESIVRANLTRITGLKLYITFMAIESPGEDAVEYQAKTERRVWQRNTHVIFCRPTPKSNATLSNVM